MEGFDEMSKRVIDAWNNAEKENKSTYDRLMKDPEFKKDFNKQYEEFCKEDEKFTNKIYTVPVEEAENGDAYIQLPKEVIATLDLKDGDSFSWNLQEDGTISLTKI